MNSIFIVLTLIFVILILRYSGVTRFLVYITGITFLPFGIELSNHLNAPRLLLFAFIISILFHSADIKTIAKFPLRYSPIFLILSHFLTGIMDPRGSFIGLYKGINVFSETYLCILLGFVSLKGKKDIKVVFEWASVLSFIVCSYSVLCLVLGYDFYSQLIGESDSMRGSRLRIASTFFDSHVAGFAISVLLLMQTAKVVILSKVMSIKDSMILILLLIALFITGSRSSLLDWIIGSFVLLFPYFLYFKGYKIKWIFFVGLAASLIFILTGDYVLSKFSDAFQEEGGDTGGSTMDMRLRQLEYSIYFYLKNPIWGNGFQYFWDEIKTKGGFYSSMLQGAESYIFILLIERGLVQIIAVCVFFFELIKTFMKRYRTDAYSYLAVALIAAFLTNSIVTGNLYKWPFVFPYVGLLLRLTTFKTKTNHVLLRNYTFIQ